MGLIDAFKDFAGGAADAYVNISSKQIEAQIAVDREAAMETVRAQIKGAPLKRFGSAVSDSMNTRVPVTADRATSLTGDELAAQGTTGGFQGDISPVRKQLLNDPNISEEDRQAALKQLDEQEASANRTAQDRVTGQTRPLSRQEAEHAAIERLSSSGDYEALQAGRGAMADKFTKIGRDDTLIDTTTGKPVFQNDTGLKRDLALEDRRDSRENERQDRSDARFAEALDARSGLTPIQRVKNKEIDGARNRIAGMSPEELRRRTSPTTATGRENPDYDPQLSARVRIANRRKYGQDDIFDQQNGVEDAGAGTAAGDGTDAGTEQPAPLKPGADPVVQKFQSDPAMKAYRMGRVTPKGYEVVDPKSSKVVGYYGRLQ